MAGQLWLNLWPPNTLRGCLTAYLTSVSGKIRPHTLRDYQDRIEWLCAVLGPGTDIAQIKLKDLERLVHDWGPDGAARLKLVTIRKRLRFLRSALLYAEGHDLIVKVPRLPPQLYDDGERGSTFYTPSQFEVFSSHLPEGAHRRFFELGFWTGHHSHDIRHTTMAMLEPDFVWRDSAGKVAGRGRYWRRNHKNRRCTPAWVPMEPEFRDIVSGWFAANPQWGERALVVGEVWGVSKMARRAAQQSGLEYVTPNSGMRRSFATMLASRGMQNEYIRHLLGHEGETVISHEGTVSTARPSIATSHYLRPSGDLFTEAMKKRSGRS